MILVHECFQLPKSVYLLISGKVKITKKVKLKKFIDYHKSGELQIDKAVLKKLNKKFNQLSYKKLTLKNLKLKKGDFLNDEIFHPNELKETYFTVRAATDVQVLRINVKGLIEIFNRQKNHPLLLKLIQKQQSRMKELIKESQKALDSLVNRLQSTKNGQKLNLALKDIKTSSMRKIAPEQSGKELKETGSVRGGGERSSSSLRFIFSEKLKLEKIELNLRARSMKRSIPEQQSTEQIQISNIRNTLLTSSFRNINSLKRKPRTIKMNISSAEEDFGGEFGIKQTSSSRFVASRKPVKKSKFLSLKNSDQSVESQTRANTNKEWDQIGRADVKKMSSFRIQSKCEAGSRKSDHSGKAETGRSGSNQTAERVRATGLDMCEDSNSSMESIPCTSTNQLKNEGKGAQRLSESGEGSEAAQEGRISERTSDQRSDPPDGEDSRESENLVRKGEGVLDSVINRGLKAEWNSQDKNNLKKRKKKVVKKKPLVLDRGHGGGVRRAKACSKTGFKAPEGIKKIKTDKFTSLGEIRGLRGSLKQSPESGIGYSSKTSKGGKKSAVFRFGRQNQNEIKGSKRSNVNRPNNIFKSQAKTRNMKERDQNDQALLQSTIEDFINSSRKGTQKQALEPRDLKGVTTQPKKKEYVVKSRPKITRKREKGQTQSTRPRSKKNYQNYIESIPGRRESLILTQKRPSTKNRSKNRGFDIAPIKSSRKFSTRKKFATSFTMTQSNTIEARYRSAYDNQGYPELKSTFVKKSMKKSLVGFFKPVNASEAEGSSRKKAEGQMKGNYGVVRTTSLPKFRADENIFMKQREAQRHQNHDQVGGRGPRRHLSTKAKNGLGRRLMNGAQKRKRFKGSFVTRKRGVSPKVIF